MPMKLFLLGGGGDSGFFLEGGGWKCQFYFYGGWDFSDDKHGRFLTPKGPVRTKTLQQRKI